MKKKIFSDKSLLSVRLRSAAGVTAVVIVLLTAARESALAQSRVMKASAARRSSVEGISQAVPKLRLVLRYDVEARLLRVDITRACAEPIEILQSSLERIRFRYRAGEDFVDVSNKSNGDEASTEAAKRGAGTFPVERIQLSFPLATAIPDTSAIGRNSSPGRAIEIEACCEATLISPGPNGGPSVRINEVATSDPIKIELPDLSQG